MSRRHAGMLGALALIWGASFLFIKVAVRELAPATLVAGRVGLAALTLAAVASAALGGRRTLRALRAAAVPLAVVGLVNTAVPFWLLSWGETRIDSGLSAIIQASVPVFAALLAFPLSPAERVGGLRLVGVLVGFAGVALLVGDRPGGELLGALAVVGMALCYAAGALIAGRFLAGTPPLVVALGTTVVAFAVMAGPGIAAAPHGRPDAETLASVAVLGIVGTAIAYMLYFAVVAGAGAARASLVTYLVPPIAVAYGVALLDEPLDPLALLALALILGGVALAARRGAPVTVDR